MRWVSNALLIASLIVGALLAFALVAVIGAGAVAIIFDVIGAFWRHAPAMLWSVYALAVVAALLVLSVFFGWLSDRPSKANQLRELNDELSRITGRG